METGSEKALLFLTDIVENTCLPLEAHIHSNAMSVIHSEEVECRRVFIYALLDDTGEVRYVGKSYNPRNRFWDHLCKSAKQKTHLGTWLRLMGKKNQRPTIVILEETSEEDWENTERKWIAHYRSAGVSLVNQTDGGDGITMTLEIREKIGTAHRGRKHTGKALENIRAAQKLRRGTKSSEETKAKIREWQKTRPPASEETKKRISTTKKGIPMSAEQRAFIRKNWAYCQTGRKASAETRQKQSVSHLGRKASDEAKRRMIEAWKKRRLAKCTLKTG